MIVLFHTILVKVQTIWHIEKWELHFFYGWRKYISYGKKDIVSATNYEGNSWSCCSKNVVCSKGMTEVEGADGEEEGRVHACKCEEEEGAWCIDPYKNQCIDGKENAKNNYRRSNT